ncbi:hypothetical protein B0H16DRAFT_1769423 [Mycena metata]|uniref:Uncharacterized protein n=1 Tax=Mycena metata TaxID=1033252 RepID=A0AAD7JXC7_9AGAR|nr:hypothetical protein B0H16DRAFT_1769423 [Mycena metata]
MAATDSSNNNVHLTPAMLGGMTQHQVVMLLQPGVNGRSLRRYRLSSSPSSNTLGMGAANGAGYDGAGSSTGGEAYPSNSTGWGWGVQAAVHGGGTEGAARRCGGVWVSAAAWGYEVVSPSAGSGEREGKLAVSPSRPTPTHQHHQPGLYAAAELWGSTVTVTVWRGAAAPEQGIRAGVLPCAALAADARGDWDRPRPRRKGSYGGGGFAGSLPWVPRANADAADFAPHSASARGVERIGGGVSPTMTEGGASD